MREISQIMGMPISLDIPGCRSSRPFEAVFAFLRDTDKRFNPYKKQSELSRYQSGKLAESEVSADMQEVMCACRDLEQRTHGYFSPHYQGRFDPTGYVKGWAIERAGKALEGLGYHTYMVNAGGDILARSHGRRVWRIGLQHPTERGKLMGLVAAGNVAVATSGTYARGRHIINPITGLPAAELLSVTVIGPEIAIADALATAVFAMGYTGLGFIETQDGYEVLIVGKDMKPLMSGGLCDKGLVP